MQIFCEKLYLIMHSFRIEMFNNVCIGAVQATENQFFLTVRNVRCAFFDSKENECVQRVLTVLMTYDSNIEINVE